jgi:hypothetical protein
VFIHNRLQLFSKDPTIEGCAPSQKLHLLLVGHFIGTGKVAGGRLRDALVTVGAVQEKVGVSVDRSQTESQDCGLAKRLVAAIPG